ncbi:hypothetical protein BpHYR1_006269 [Brachionus plicatilis]|uniref:Uncharacterized protein n=1 Tax=Brachionus plicatilis TaxID=10195 RepID=A0A3M7RBE5_BRAPC|nr:hypothetical protein BpHYR1_006269 [Brachionus plicatilis]
MNDQNATLTGYSVYLLYQKEVYSSDHSLLQSMMEWLYTSVDSPLKFSIRNKAQVNITHNGILIQKECSANSRHKADANTWNHIFFNFRHLKEIYVDKRHKDTCVLVSKVSGSTQSNNIWRKSNPSNYESFRFAYAMNKAYKKSFLLTILKFRDGPTRLLQSIQLLDSVLVDYNKREELINKNLKNNSKLNSIIVNAIKGNDKAGRKSAEPSQFYSNVVKSTSRHSIDSIIKLPKHTNYVHDASYDTVSLSRLRNSSQQAIDPKPSRNFSIDRLYQNVNTSSTSLHNFQSNYVMRPSSSNNVSRQSSVNDLRAENAPLHFNRGFTANDIKIDPCQFKPQESKLAVRPSALNPSWSTTEANVDTGKNIRIKLSSENEETESNRQLETVIERKKDEDTTRNDYDDTINTNTLIEDFSSNNNNNNTETMNDLDTLNYDFSSNGPPQNAYLNLFRDDTKSKSFLNSHNISSLVHNASMSSSTGLTDNKDLKTSNTRVKEIINSFNSLTNPNKKSDHDSFDQAGKNLDLYKISTMTNLKVGNGAPPPVKTVQNDFSYNQANIGFNRPPAPFTYLAKPDQASLTLNVNPVSSNLNNFYQGNYFSKSESINNLNNDINLINNKLTQIVNLLSISDILEDKNKKLSEKTSELKEKSADDLAKYKTHSATPPVATVAPIKKRTFANMVWPMDPEEEKILRSTSPFVVPEIIMQKNERVKGILKKSNSYLTNSVSGYDLTSHVNQSMTRSTSTLTNYNIASIMSANKKRVDFHENFCYINFFDKNEDN